MAKMGTYKFNIAVTSQNEWLENSLRRMSNSTGNFFSATFNTVFIMFLTPVFSALFLYNRKDFVLVLTKLLTNTAHIQLTSILNESIHTYFNFIKGMLMV